jgi:glycosyltransferase involved in cell wall biosynthesis
MTWEKLETHAFGAWLPELEFTHYHATKLWEKAMDSCSRFAAVSGNALAALPFAQTKRPFTAWVATGWEEDRLDRVAKFPLYRKWLDQWINSPVLRKKEREILQAGEILALSEHTRTALDKLAGESVCDDVMPMPIDGDFFRPDIDNVCVGRVGFTGRLDDPRKNISLLIESLAGLVKVGVDATAVLVGGELDTHCAMQINLSGLSNRIRILDYVPRNELRKLLQSFDVFLLPSHQEGLCISALEAMACGCPVISTRCGGPEEFVKDHETGFLVDFDAEEMADAINRIINNRSLRQRLSEGARQLVLEQYSRERCERVFWKAFESKSVIETGTVH